MKPLFIYVALALLPVLCMSQYSLALKLEKGKKYYHITNAVSEMHQEIGEGIDIATVISGTNSYLVSGSTDSIYHIKANYEELGMKMKVGPQEMEFNSTAGKTDLVSQLMSSFINHPFNMDMTVHGKILNVDGMNSMLTNMTAKIPMLTEDQKKALEKQMRDSYGSEALKSSLNTLTAIYPATGKVNKDEKWVSTIDMAGTMKLTVQMTYQLTGEGTDYYLIHGEGVMTTPENAGYTSSNGIEMKQVITGKMTSDIRIDKTTGWIKEAKTIQKGEGSIHIKESPMMPDGTEIPMHFTNTIEVKGN
jgi:hypothetical protein